MDEKQKKIDDLMKDAASYMTTLLAGKKTGNYNLSIEVNLNSGGIRDAYFSCTAREKAA
jgi:hypothetical protein